MSFVRNTFTVTGGLGNQLFILAAADAFATQTGKPYRLNFSQVDANVASHGNSLRAFIPATAKTSWLIPSRRASLARVLMESSLEKLTPANLKFLAPPENVGYSSELLEFSGNKSIIRGYFQSHTYLTLGSGLVQKVFSSMQSSATWASEVSSNFFGDEVVGFHMRRGDYLSHADSLGLLDYSNIARNLSVLNSGRPVAIFCQDLEFAQSVADQLGGQAFIVKKPAAISDFEELVAMANCRALVASNSSFSFWAALLGAQKEVHYPMPWFRNHPSPVDLAPKEWFPYEAVWEAGS